MADFVWADLVCDAFPDWRATVPVTGPGRTKRRILLFFMRYGVTTQPASLVRGSSRRITIMRFRPADIRVINRRICLLSCYLPCRLLVSKRKPQPGST
jgi:hypothetical protein